MPSKKSPDPEEVFCNIPAVESSSRIELDILSQPDETTCGPTSLQAVYRYYGDDIPLDKVIREVHKFEDGGTLAVWLGCHALKRGYDALLYTCNLQLFDPTWFQRDNVDLYRKLQEQLQYKKEKKMQRASHAYMDFLRLGGEVRFEDFTRELFRKYLSQKVPILTGLSSTYLYRSAREVSEPALEYDDIRGEPGGHFVILCGYDKDSKKVLVADPHAMNPFSTTRKYEIGIERVICSILLGILTYDANFLIIRPRV